ncbi:MAG TPA: NADH-quinone oxidoreductase subunit I [Candidatus Methylomirabilis sp.]|nr:NADH-quinone oxidoreductase subunit I [Candidatus Methylomirabilis sp.]
MIAYLRDVWAGFLTVLYAMRVTLRHLFTPAVTVQYPTVRRTLPLRSLNRHVLTVDLATGKLKCTACDACAKACPTRCITIVGAGKGKERHPVEFVIDHNLCMYCNLCVEACPFDAITMWTGNFEIGAFNRRGLLFDQTALHAEKFYPTPETPELVEAAPAAKEPAAVGPSGA